MPSKPDAPCSVCGTLLWGGSGSLPAGERTCQPCRRSKAPKKPVMATCPCGAEFRRTGYQLYCSKECRPKRRRSYTERTCTWCAAVFTAAGYHQERCSIACGSRRDAKAEVIPWASCLRCRGWFVCRNGRRVHGSSCPEQGPPDRPPCRTCGASIPYSGAGMPRRFCSTACMKRHPPFKANRRAAKARRRARLRGAETETFAPLEVFERDRWTCHLCGRRTLRTEVVPHPRAPTLDHVIPLAQGGPHTRANTRCACFLCNAIKGDRSTQPEQLALIG